MVNKALTKTSAKYAFKQSQQIQKASEATLSGDQTSQVPQLTWVYNTLKTCKRHPFATFRHNLSHLIH